MSTEASWQKSSFSDDGPQCIEIAEHSGTIAIRESDDPNMVASTSRSKFSAFIASVKTGEFDHLTD